MAGTPPAVVSLAGTVRGIEKFESTDRDSGEVREACRVTVLTEPNGGFGEVYVGRDDQAVLAGLDVGASVTWHVTVRAGNRSFERSDGTRTNPFAQLWLRFVSVAETATGARRLAPTG